MNKWTKVIKSNENEAKKHLRNLIYQVNNGGILQYCFNGYADDLLEYIKSHDIIQELKNLGCPEDGIKLMEGTIDKLQNEIPQTKCQYCDGTGQIESDEEDEEGNTDVEDCYECNGNGWEDAEKWAETDDQYWMEYFDEWFYKFNMDKLDDWTEQSHTHSVILDQIKENNKMANKWTLKKKASNMDNYYNAQDIPNTNIGIYDRFNKINNCRAWQYVSIFSYK